MSVPSRRYGYQVKNGEVKTEIKPLLKWAGGKRHIASIIESFLPTSWRNGTYFEPFFGGGAMFFHLTPKRAQISDRNSRLVGFYTHLKGDFESLLKGIEIEAFNFNALSPHSKTEYFYSLRERFNSSEKVSLESAVLIYCLNKLCFNGLYRENSKGMFNVPFGKKSMLPLPNVKDFQLTAKALSCAKIENQDFDMATKRAKLGDVVYFDPPYVPLNSTSSFTSYQAEGFSLNEQKRLSDLMNELGERGVYTICSNSATSVTRDIFRDHKQFEIDAPRMVSAKSSGRGVVKELVIINF